MGSHQDHATDRSSPRTREPPPPQARYATVSDSRTIHDSLTKRTPLPRHSAKRTCPYIVLLGEVRAYSCGCVHVRSNGAGGCALVVTVHSWCICVLRSVAW